MPENGSPPLQNLESLLAAAKAADPKSLTLFEQNVLGKLSAVTVAIYALTAQMEAGRMQRTSAEPEEINATAKHAQDVATLALKLAGALPLVEKLGAQEAGG